jgi:hypothetical protein
MPESDMLSVRGMGVAVSVRTSIVGRSCRMRSFARTPKRCSSSTTRSPSCSNATSCEQAVRADHDVDLALGEARERRLVLRRGAEAGHHLDDDRIAREARAEGLQVLLREHRSSAPARRPASRRGRP